MLEDWPDWIYLQGWGATNLTALKEVNKINFPTDRLVGVWWAAARTMFVRQASQPKATLPLISAASVRFLGDPGHSQIRSRQGQSQVTSKDKIGEN